MPRDDASVIFALVSRRGRAPRASRPCREPLSPWTAQLTEPARRVAAHRWVFLQIYFRARASPRRSADASSRRPSAATVAVVHRRRVVSIFRDTSRAPDPRENALYAHAYATFRGAARSPPCPVRVMCRRDAWPCIRVRGRRREETGSRARFLSFSLSLSLSLSFFLFATIVIHKASPTPVTDDGGRARNRSISEPAAAGFLVAYARRYCAIQRVRKTAERAVVVRDFRASRSLARAICEIPRYFTPSNRKLFLG